MTAATTAALAATARRRRVTAAPAGPAAGHRTSDPCPHCRVELAVGAGSTSRRLAVLTRTPGAFTWRCPDCRATWTEQPSHAPGRGRARA